MKCCSNCNKVAIFIWVMGIKVDEAHDKGGDSLRDRIRYLHPENLHPRYFFD